MLNRKKKILIIVGLLVIIIVILIFSFLETKSYAFDGPVADISNVASLYEPEFMNSEEKAQFDLPEESKIQILKRNDLGDTEVYKVIRNDSDLVTDLSKIQ